MQLFGLQKSRESSQLRQIIPSFTIWSFYLFPFSSMHLLAILPHTSSNPHKPQPVSLHLYHFKRSNLVLMVVLDYELCNAIGKNLDFFLIWQLLSSFKYLYLNFIGNMRLTLCEKVSSSLFFAWFSLVQRVHLHLHRAFRRNLSIVVQK